MRILFYIFINFFIFCPSFSMASKPLNSTVVSIVCDTPNSIFTKGKNYVLKHDEKKKLTNITLQLDKIDSKVRFKRAGEWSSWLEGQFSKDEINWAVVSQGNNENTKEIFKDFEYWNFNFDLLNRRVVESFVEKVEEESESTPVPRGFNYPNCRIVEPLSLN